MRRPLLTTGLLLATLALPLPAAQAGTCSLAGKERSLGPTYTTSLRTTAVKCTTGKRLVRAFYGCRVANGGKDGTCRRRVLEFRCKERRSNVIRTQFDARVTCTRGSRKVVHTYTQFT